MPRKTRKQKRSADERRVINTPTRALSVKEDLGANLVRKKADPKKNPVQKQQFVAAYTESEYDKKLRGYTHRDATKTLLIICVLFLLQAGFFYFWPI